MKNRVKNIKELTKEIKKISSSLGKTSIMEICGTHTMAIGKYGLRQLLPENINLISGPGCPVCVTPTSDIDSVIDLVLNNNIILYSFGDLLKVPGSKMSLIEAKSINPKIKICYSPLDALDFAINNPSKKIVFVAIGFETTAPLTASIIKKVFDLKLKNLFIYNTHKLVPPAILFLLNTNKKIKVDAFLCPGHVCAVIGSKPFEFISQNFKKPAVISGFGAEDILSSILMILLQLKENKPKTEIQYKTVVKEHGNLVALDFINDVFRPKNSNWRGIGEIPDSGLEIQEKYSYYDAKKVFNIIEKPVEEPKNCQCGNILQGIIKPFQCKLFGKDCIPESPVGPCMVSSEGTCAAYFKYEKYSKSYIS